MTQRPFQRRIQCSSRSSRYIEPSYISLNVTSPQDLRHARPIYKERAALPQGAPLALCWSSPVCHFFHWCILGALLALRNFRSPLILELPLGSVFWPSLARANYCYLNTFETVYLRHNFFILLFPSCSSPPFHSPCGLSSRHSARQWCKIREENRTTSTFRQKYCRIANLTPTICHFCDYQGFIKQEEYEALEIWWAEDCS